MNGLKITASLSQLINPMQFYSMQNSQGGLPHLNYICKKVESSINIMRALSGVRWGSHPYSQKILYNAIVRSHFDYGCFLLEPCQKLALCKLDKLQSRCLRIVTGARKSSPINALQVECAEPPLHLRRQYLSDRYLCNVLQISTHPLLEKLRILSELVRNSAYWNHKVPPALIKSLNKLFNLPTIHQTGKNPIFEINYKSLIYQPKILLNTGIDGNTTNANEKFNNILTQNWNEWLHIFTDASKLSDDSNVGSAVWIPKYKILLNFKCPPQASVYIGEIIAILEAILYAEYHKLNKCIIFTDSLSCLQDIQKLPFHSRYNFYITLQTKDALARCASAGIELILAWIPGHRGIIGNETADLFAKEATQNGSLSYYRCYPRDLRTLARPQIYKSWDFLWQQSRTVKGIYYGNLQPDIPRKPWFFRQRNMNKFITSIIIRLRLGHVNTPVFLAKLRIRDNSLCECGLEDGTVEHIFFRCLNIQNLNSTR
ncbi:unnamed protein product [Chilo suppressalis]|uniref:ribonuclease H n=1 Tax=Chilo suppressalis TaxID=168631 RepID=A0ABN8ASI4_CHISP|nr:unnamed protein product [Chilo suppressalis]